MLLSFPDDELDEDPEDDWPPPKIDDCSPLPLLLLSLEPPKRFVTFSTTEEPTARSLVVIPPRFAFVFAAPLRPAALRRADVVLRDFELVRDAEERFFDPLLLRDADDFRLDAVLRDLELLAERFAPPPLLPELRRAAPLRAPALRLADVALRLTAAFLPPTRRAVLLLPLLFFEPPAFFALLLLLPPLLLLLLPLFFEPPRLAEERLLDDFDDDRDLELDLPDDDLLLDERFFAGMSLSPFRICDGSLSHDSNALVAIVVPSSLHFSASFDRQA